MKKLTKNQKQLILLGVLFAAILAVLGVFVFRPTETVQDTYVPKTVDTRIPDELVKRQDFRNLRLPIELPLVVGRMGRENPFEPYH